ncbi:hypothetical protein TGFOU_402510 [Toxoplasma gondii FOU]|uniref:Uncharacterized protein n=1 Tax=Toxoplasma gondii FOU TaxID=943167 RepID=A0A086LI41_TOXGO|nr:hypothetical protein TGFOU_402510 [Toxoplasma gondii FOU]
MKEAVAVPLASVEEKERQKLQKKEETEKEVEEKAIEEKKARKKKEILAEDALEEKASWRADPVAASRPRKASDTPPTSPTVAWSSPKAELKKERKLPKNVPSPVLAAKKFGGRERGALPGRQSHGVRREARERQRRENISLCILLFHRTLCRGCVKTAAGLALAFGAFLLCDSLAQRSCSLLSPFRSSGPQFGLVSPDCCLSLRSL